MMENSGFWDRPYIDKNGQGVIDSLFDKAFPFSSGLARIMLYDWWSYIDKKGQLMTEDRFDATTDFHCGVAMVWIGKKAFVIDTEGKTNLIE